VDVAVPIDDAVTCTKGLLEIVGVTTIHFFVGITFEVVNSEPFFCSEECIEEVV